jgi:hypothetical protein
MLHSRRNTGHRTLKKRFTDEVPDKPKVNKVVIEVWREVEAAGRAQVVSINYPNFRREV